MRPAASARRRTLAALVVGWLALAPYARARPVTIGRYAEVPYGIDPHHPWPATGGGPRRQGNDRHAVPAHAPSVEWEAQVGPGMASTPALAADGAIYVVTGSGLTALAPDGKVRWSLPMRFILGTPSITPDGQLLLALRTGSIVWVSRAGDVVSSVAVGAGVSAPPLVLDDGSVVVATRDSVLKRLDARGTELFRLALPRMATRPPAWGGRGRIIVPVGSELLFVSTDGHVLARVALGDIVVAGPAVADDGTTWVLAGDGVLSGFDAQGRLSARANVGEMAASSPLAVGPGGAVRVATRDGALVCIGPTGAERWRLKQGGPFLGRISVDPAGVTLVLTVQGNLVAVGPDGAVRWQLPADLRGVSDPVVGADGTVYVGTALGTVQALGPRSHEHRGAAVRAAAGAHRTAASSGAGREPAARARP